jgi:hypothetical protein
MKLLEPLSDDEIFNPARKKKPNFDYLFELGGKYLTSDEEYEEEEEEKEEDVDDVFVEPTVKLKDKNANTQKTGLLSSNYSKCNLLPTNEVDVDDRAFQSILTYPMT